MANDIFEILAEDHRRVEGIIDALENTNDNETRSSLLNDLTLALVPHARAEERLIYPHVKEHERGRELEGDAEEEHAMAEELVGELVAMGGGAEEFSEKLQQLKTAVEQHVKVEESDMFSIGREIFDEEQNERLAIDFETVKEEVQAALEGVAAGKPLEQEPREAGGAAAPA